MPIETKGPTEQSAVQSADTPSTGKVSGEMKADVTVETQSPKGKRISHEPESIKPSQTSTTERAAATLKASDFSSMKERSVALFEALKRSDSEAFEAILQGESPQNIMTLLKMKNQDGKTVSYIATQGQNTDILNIIQKNISSMRSTPQFSSIEERSTALFEALKNDDLEFFEAILKDSNMEDLMKMHNSEGETIAHVAAKKGDLKALLRVEKSYGSSIDLIKNAKDEEIVSILKEKGLESAFIKLREADIEFSKEGIRQYLLLEKFARYLQIKCQQNPAEYKAEDVAIVIKELEDGHCSGFAVMWAQLSLLGEEEKYFQIMNEIAKWDGSAETLTIGLEKTISEMMQIAIFYQQGKRAEQEHINPALPAFQEDFSKIVGDGKLVTPIALWGFQVDNMALTIALKTLLNEQNAAYLVGGRSSTWHAISLSMRNGEYILCDSNYTGNEEGYSEEVSGRVFQTIEELAEEVKESIYTRIHGDLGDNYLVDIFILDLKENNNSYMSEKELKGHIIEQQLKIMELQLEDKRIVSPHLEAIKTKLLKRAPNENLFDLFREMGSPDLINDPHFIKSLIDQSSVESLNSAQVHRLDFAGVNRIAVSSLGFILSSNSTYKDAIVKYLIEKGADPLKMRTSNQTILDYARGKVSPALLERMTEAANKKLEPFYEAIEESDSEALNALLEKEGDDNASLLIAYEGKRDTLAHFAVDLQDLDSLLVLSKHYKGDMKSIENSGGDTIQEWLKHLSIEEAFDEKIADAAETP